MAGFCGQTSDNVDAHITWKLVIRIKKKIGTRDEPHYRLMRRRGLPVLGEKRGPGEGVEDERKRLRIQS